MLTDKTEKNIRRYFPNKGIDQIMRFNAINLVLSPNSNPSSNPQGEFRDGIKSEYSSSDQKNKLSISNKFLVIDVANYKNFEEIQRWLQDIVLPFLLKNKLTVIRTGIRYINVFDPDKIRIRKNFFSPEIAATMNVKTFDENSGISLTQSMHRTEYHVKGMRLFFRYGFHNPQYPGPLLNKSFALDYDCCTNETVEAAEGLLQYVKDAHDAIQTLFESSITDALRKVMRHE